MKTEKESYLERSEYYLKHKAILEERKEILIAIIEEKTNSSISKKEILEKNSYELELSDLLGSIESTDYYYQHYKSRYDSIVKQEEYITDLCNGNYPIITEQLKSEKIKSKKSKLTKEHQEHYDRLVYEVDWEDSETRTNQLKKNTLFQQIVQMVEHMEKLK